ncbi:MAG: hypothetical protein MR022_03660 [Ruminococcus sp.]|nr:hypothetical protein [Ruminococcus sp.]
MKMNKILAAVAATAISATSFAAMSISSASAADALGVAYIGGGLGAEQRWNAADQEAAGSTVATVDGNAQYEVTWKVPENGGTDTVQFLAVMIKPADGVDNFNIDTFPNLSLSVDEVWIDGTKLDYTASADAINTNYYENGEGYSRIYLTNDWVEPKIYDLPMATNITQEVKVVFTVSGLDTDGTSNVTKNEPSTTTTADSTVTTTTAASGDDKTTTTAAKGGDKKTTTAAPKGGDKTTTTAAKSGDVASAGTGDLGVGAAVAAIAVAGVAAFVSRKKD